MQDVDGRDKPGHNSKQMLRHHRKRSTRADREQRVLAALQLQLRAHLTKIMKRSVPFVCIDKCLTLCIKLPDRGGFLGNASFKSALRSARRSTLRWLSAAAFFA